MDFIYNKMLPNSFKIHDENAVASQNQKSFSSSSNSSIPLKNSLKPALAPRKALGDISANKLNVRASQSDVKDGGPMKPANSRQDFKIISKVPSCKIVETNYPSNNESLIKASSASQIKDTTVDFDIVSVIFHYFVFLIKYYDFTFHLNMCIIIYSIGRGDEM